MAILGVLVAVGVVVGVGVWVTDPCIVIVFWAGLPTFTQFWALFTRRLIWTTRTLVPGEHP